MPSWNMHLEAGERFWGKLKIAPEKKKEFLLGCILPDINNGFLNKARVVKGHAETHYAFDEKSSLNFFFENREEIEKRTPIFLGYLFHLFMDGYFNYDFYHNDGRGGKVERTAEVKHHDFWLFDTKFRHEIGVENMAEAEELATLANEIDTVKVSAAEIMEVEEILRGGMANDELKGQGYWYYSEVVLESLIDEMIQEFEEQYLWGGYRRWENA